jgi:hypothetical protein
LHAESRQRPLHLIELEWFDNGGDELHGLPAFP